jgi:hypothetical protein
MAVEDFPVEAGHIELFARAIGDTNPIYHNSEQAATTDVGGIIAPPTFVQAGSQFDPDYPLRPKIGQPWMGSGKTATGITKEKLGQSAGVLHAEQHFEYHRQLKPGDILSALSKQGKNWEKQGRRGGNLKFSESITEYRDQNGELVVTALSVGVITEKPASND